MSGPGADAATTTAVPPPAPSGGGGLAKSLLSSGEASGDSGSDPRLAQAQAGRSSEKEATLSQAAVSAESAMNSIAMRMANKLMGQVEKLEGSSKNPSNSDLISSMKSTVSFGSTTRPTMGASMSSTRSTERFSASPIKRSSRGGGHQAEGDEPYGDKQYKCVMPGDGSV